MKKGKGKGKGKGKDNTVVKSKKKKEEEEKKLLDALQDFTSKENWDEFFKLRSEEPFEWYGDWSVLKNPILQHCNPSPSSDILIPGCGNSELSEKLYDEGFIRITNIDFSKVVIHSMLRKHLRSRPSMLWRVMDVTQMQLPDGSFDLVIDKGSLDALMEPEMGPMLGIQFLSEVKRVLRNGGKYVCISLVQTHVIELLLSKFRFGWKVSIHGVPRKPGDSVSSYHPFLITATKEDGHCIQLVMTALDSNSYSYTKSQSTGLIDVVTKENTFRTQHVGNEDVLYSFEELQLGAKGDLGDLVPGRRIRATLDEPSSYKFSYKAVIMDAYEHFGPFSYSCGAFLVPKARAREWLFLSKEGQWQIAESAKARRLIIIFLDAELTNIEMEVLQRDLSPLIEYIAPTNADKGSKIPFMMAGDDVAKREVLEQVESPLTGKIVVEDVILATDNESDDVNSSHQGAVFRRLIFERNYRLVQSEALLSLTDPSNKIEGIKNTNKTGRHSSSGVRKIDKDNFSNSSPLQCSKYVSVDHTYLSSSYHGGMIAGLGLIVPELEYYAFMKEMARTVVIGLGAGILPMFLHKYLKFLQIEVVELDPFVADIARKYFAFTEDEQLKLQIADGIQVINEFATNVQYSVVADEAKSLEGLSLQSNGQTTKPEISPGSGKENNNINRNESCRKYHVIIIDVDSDDPSAGLSCPHPNFVEETFLKAAKEALHEEGIFILNLVTRSSAIQEMVISRAQKVFEQLICLEVEEDVNLILFALPKQKLFEGFSDALTRLEKLFANNTIIKKSLNIQKYAGSIKIL